jgi:hypothetical protein
VRIIITDERPLLSLEPWWLLAGFWQTLGKDIAVKRVADALIEHVDALSVQERKVILQDITNAIERDTAGSASAVEQWRRVAEVMKRA